MEQIILSDQLKLRALRPENHSEHFALMHRIYPPAFAYLWPDGGVGYAERIHGKDAFLRDLLERDAPYFRVEWRGAPIGILRWQVGKPSPDLPDLAALKLDRLYLGPEARGKGVGTQLLRFIFDTAARLGKSLVWLERMDSNDGTIAFYRSRGFVEGGAFRYDGPAMLDEYRGMTRLFYVID